MSGRIVFNSERSEKDARDFMDISSNIIGREAPSIPMEIEDSPDPAPRAEDNKPDTKFLKSPVANSIREHIKKWGI
jgi:hypothetical protein